MKKLTIEEKIQLVPIGGKSGSSPVRKHSFELGVGEVIFLPKREWKNYKYSPKTTIGSLLWNKTKKFSVKQNIFNKERGYAITRIK